MKFTPKTEEQIKTEQEMRGAWPPGIYDAEITTATDTTSKAGNDMIALTLKVYHPDGEHKQVLDWLVEQMAHKLRHCASACGLMDKYEAGELQGWQMEGRPVKVKLGIDTSGEVKRNKIMDYVVPADAPAGRAPARAAPARPAKPNLDDDIPF